ncbi:hypothetical protein DL93DRAFT_2099661 [Clavulina sp. PMI_390]|nr:hypothetical protein DL93DRAFT_2099661 [Clavulina sp. PMI_390]
MVLLYILWKLTIDGASSICKRTAFVIGLCKQRDAGLHIPDDPPGTRLVCCGSSLRKGDEERGEWVEVPRRLERLIRATDEGSVYTRVLVKRVDTGSVHDNKGSSMQELAIMAKISEIVTEKVEPSQGYRTAAGAGRGPGVDQSDVESSWPLPWDEPTPPSWEIP